MTVHYEKPTESKCVQASTLFDLKRKHDLPEGIFNKIRGKKFFYKFVIQPFGIIDEKYKMCIFLISFDDNM